MSIILSWSYCIRMLSNFSMICSNAYWVGLAYTRYFMQILSPVTSISHSSPWFSSGISIVSTIDIDYCPHLSRARMLELATTMVMILGASFVSFITVICSMVTILKWNNIFIFPLYI